MALGFNDAYGNINWEYLDIIMDAAHLPPVVEERTMDVHIRRQRTILEEHGREDLVQSVRGFGYRFSLQG